MYYQQLCYAKVVAHCMRIATGYGVDARVNEVDANISQLILRRLFAKHISL